MFLRYWCVCFDKCFERSGKTAMRRASYTSTNLANTRLTVRNPRVQDGAFVALNHPANINACRRSPKVQRW